MFLPPSSEKAPLTPPLKRPPNKIAEKAVLFVQSQAFPVGWSVLRLGLGFSGILNVFYGSTALADTGFKNPAPADSVTATTLKTTALALHASASQASTHQAGTHQAGTHQAGTHQTGTHQTGIEQENHHRDRAAIATSHHPSHPWETAKASQTSHPTALSFHPAPLLTEMGTLTRTLMSNEAIAQNHSQNHSQHLTIQTERQPKFFTASTPRTAPEAQLSEAQLSEAQQNTASEMPTGRRLRRNQPPLDIAKLSEPATLSALSQPTDRHSIGDPIFEGDVEPAAALPERTLEALIAGSQVAQNPVDQDLTAEGLITGEIANSAEAIPSEIEGFPNANGAEKPEGRPDIGPGIIPDALEAPEEAGDENADSDDENADSENVGGENVGGENVQLSNNELGTLRVQPTRSRASEELGILRLIQTAQAPPPPPKPPISFLTGRLGFFSSENAFRSNPRIDESIYQSGLAYYLFPKLSDETSLYAIAETNLARYDQFQSVNYNELEVQLGVRQRLLPRTYAQIGWRNQRLYSPGYREKLFSVNYIDTMVSHRSILNSKTWVDGFYQARLGFANPETASRFRQTFTVSLNYGATRDLRTSLLYQLDFDDYTQVSRYDTYQQLLGIISYNLTPESRISVFGGTRFGRSSSPGVSLDDTFYGAGLNVSVPLF